MKIKNSVFALMTGALLMSTVPFTASAAEDFTVQNLADGTVELTWKNQEMTSVTVPEEVDGKPVSALAEDCFKGCSMKEIILPETITVIHDYAFHGCNALETISLPATVTEIGDFVFEGCTSLQEITIPDSNSNYCSVEGVLYSEDTTSLIRYPAAKPEQSYTIADSCTVLEPWSFTECSQLRELSMKNVKTIGADTFFCANSLETVELSEGLNELIGASFAYCANLKHINFPSTLESVGDKCFYGCVSLPAVDLPAKLNKIGEQAFYGCVQVKEIEIPDSVKEIGDMAVGYSVDPDTNENAVIKGFQLKTVSRSQAQKYASKNNIPCESTTKKSFLGWVLIAAVLIGIVGGVVYFTKRSEDAAALEAQKREEKRLRKGKKKNN